MSHITPRSDMGFKAELRRSRSSYTGFCTYPSMVCYMSKSWFPTCFNASIFTSSMFFFFFCGVFLCGLV